MQVEDDDGGAPPEAAAAAEELRLDGNAAFSAKKWNLAIKKYNSSIELDGSSKYSAKVYSNLAAALCKVSKYDDAYEAAKQGTKVDVDWAKGHWRLGVVCELQKDYLHSFTSYAKAVELAPEEAAFITAKEKMMKRLGCTEKRDADGKMSLTIELPPTSTNFIGDPPAIIAWERALKRTNNFANHEAFLPNRWEEKSEYWLLAGLNQWFRAMTKQLGQLADLPHPKNGGITQKVDAIKMALHKGQISTEDYTCQRRKIIGVPPSTGEELNEFMAALTLLMGDHIPVESRDDGRERFVSSPPWIWYMRTRQFVAIQELLCREVLHLKMMGEMDGKTTIMWDGVKSKEVEIVISPAMCAMAKSFWVGICGNKDIVAKEGTPEKVVAYIKKRLKGGLTWEENNGIRRFISSVYRGTVLSAWVARLTAGLGVALRYFKWANRFIDLADETWKVSESGNYNKYGSSFRKSFRVCILAMELRTQYTNRDNEFNTHRGDVLYEINLAQRIISYASEQSPPTTNQFDAWNFYMSFGRKPLAFALASLGSSMHTMWMDKPSMLKEMIKEAGLMDAERDDNLISFLIEKTGKEYFSVVSMIAETYHVAAMTQLPDDQETAILWWAYGAHICYAGGYKMKDLRGAINKAIVATQQMDGDLWGPSKWRGSSHQKLSLLVERYFQEKSGSFVLPMVKQSSRPDGSLAIFCGDLMICTNFDRAIQLDIKRHKESRTDVMDEYFDTSVVEQEHGAEVVGQEHDTASS